MFLRTLEAVAATDTTLANSPCNRETTGLDLHFRPGMGENEGVAAVEPGGKRQSTGLSHLIGSSPCFTK